jgi:biotin synthase-like enzyme
VFKRLHSLNLAPVRYHLGLYSAMDMEVCTTLGMLSPEQAQQLKQAGLTAYNHNLDTSREYYPKVSGHVRQPWQHELC